MKITHKVSDTTVTKNTDQDPQFLLSNKIGGYCLLGSTPSSRYQGVFHFDRSGMFKIIENISLIDAQPVSEIINELSQITRKRGNLNETFFMPYGYDALVYGLNQEEELELTLDIRKSYEDPDLGRAYKISKTKLGLIINYRHEKTNMYLVIKTDANQFKPIKEWVKREYEYDKARGTIPFEKYVFKALRLKAKTAVFAFGLKKQQVIDEANYVFKNLVRLKEHQNIYVSKINTKIAKDPELRIAKKCAVNSLNKQLINLKNNRGIFAGLPWFFQFWTRDELIALNALMLNKQNREFKDIILNNLKLVNKARLVNLRQPKSEQTNADSIGWLFKRISDNLKIFSAKEKETIKKKLESAIKETNANYIKDGLVFNNPKETWMDTHWDYDSREGVRIEIQALFLNMLRLAYQLTKNKKYLNQEQDMKNIVREKFWNKRWLADGLEDHTVRPNIFIAAYIYPELLSKTEWTLCFENIIPKLWLNWGGFSTIEKSHPLFCNENTGESHQSYHRGDSWFWINNLAALVMKRTNKKKFEKYISKITQASAKEILTSGAIGHSAELSSASKLESKGCIAQAWSNAMFIELIEEL